MNGTRALLALGIAGFTLLIISLTSAHHHSDRPAHPTRTHAAGPSAAASPPSTASSPPPVAARDVAQLLPFDQDQIAQAAQTATSFTAAYASHRFDESAQQYLARLAPMMSAQLRPTLERAAADPATLGQRRRQHEVALGQAHAEVIRTLGPSSITFLLTATTHITTSRATRQEAASYAVTVTRSGDGWQVYAIELASTGDTGDGGDAP